MDQATQTYPLQPSPEDSNKGFKRMVRMVTIFQSPAFQSPDLVRHPRARSVDYMVCPCHEDRLEEGKSQKGWEYVKCPRYPCNFFRWANRPLGQKYRQWLFNKEEKLQHPLPTRDSDGYPLRGYDIPGSLPPSPRVRRKEDIQQERPLTDSKNQLLREIQELKNRQEVLVASAPPPPRYSDSVQNWQKGLETVA